MRIYNNTNLVQTVAGYNINPKGYIDITSNVIDDGMKFLQRIQVITIVDNCEDKNINKVNKRQSKKQIVKEENETISESESEE